MNIVSIRRIFTFAALVLMLTVSIVAQAEPLPLPQLPDGVRGPVFAVPVTALHYPLDGTALNQMNQLSWTNVGADSYAVKMTVLENGQRIKKNVTPDACNATYCNYMPNKTDFYPLVRDGQSVKWKVVAKFVDGGDIYKSKSNVRTFIVDEISAPVLLSPASGVTITGEGVTWDVDSSTVQWQVLYVKHTETGEVTKVKYDTNGGCTVPCAIYPSDLEQDATYKWWVQAKGFTGESAVSEKRTFYVPVSDKS